MRYICLSFDDARSDTYDYAFQILKKYGMKATVNVISNFVIQPENYHFSSSPVPMTVEQIKEWQYKGLEIACHGSTHQNTATDVKKNIEELIEFGIDTDKIGFASPESYITCKNIEETGIDKLKRDGLISYIRTGIQVRREGPFFMALSILEQLTHNNLLFYSLNKKNIINIHELPEILPSTAIKDYTNVNQIKYFLERIDDEHAAILMFHSILPEDNPNYGKDHYYWSVDNFEKLCNWLASRCDIEVLTTYDLLYERSI